MDQLAKSTTAVMHKMVLMQDWIATLEKANHILSKCWREKKTHIHQGGSLTIQDAGDILDGRELDEQLGEEMHTITDQELPAGKKKRQCGNCGKPGHNVCTCREDVEMSSESDSS